MPAKMHTFYLRNMYIKNLLAKPGGITLGGEALDMGKVKTPSCFVSTFEDHIAPWKSTYMGARTLGGPVKFILGGSGHIAGIVNPPAANKYHYWASDKLAASADEWLASAQRTPGSWWSAWNEWISAFGGEKIAARKPGDGKLRVLDDAPGSYAKLRLDAAGKDAPPVPAANNSAPAIERAANEDRVSPNPAAERGATSSDESGPPPSKRRKKKQAPR